MSKNSQARAAAQAVMIAAQVAAHEDAETAQAIPLPLTQAALKATVGTTLLTESPTGSGLYTIGD
jgi:hypothetical protein